MNKRQALAHYNQWRKIAEPIERATGLIAWGYDPYLFLFDPNQPGREHEIELPRWFAELLANALEKK